jgi:hypothetical protein
MNARRSAYALCALIAGLFFSRAARAETLQTAIGSKAIPLGEARVACAAPGGGWTIEPSSQLHAVRPPDSTDAVGTVVELKVAPNLAACSTGATTIKRGHRASIRAASRSYPIKAKQTCAVTA